MDYLEYCLWLVMTFGTANFKIWEIIQRFENPENAYNSLKAGNDDFLSAKEKNAVKTTHLKQCSCVIENCARKDIRILSFYDKNYPKRLKNISNPPVVLFAKGDLTAADDLCITVVGTRNPSVYSINAAEKICSELAKVGVVIASGFALGIDSVAHRSAIMNGSRTIAVIGCGIDVDYPKENTKSKKAVAAHGLILSECLPGTKPLAANFPKRNRILSGISSGTLVVEASQTSGSLITAEFAVEQGRDLFCIPPADIFDKRYSGVIKFLRDGATPVFSHLDIIYEYYTNFTHKLSSLNIGTDYYESASEASVFTSEKTDKTVVHHTRKKSDIVQDKSQSRKDDVQHNEEKSSPSIDYDKLDDEQKKIVLFLKDGMKYIDEIAAATDNDIPSMYLKLTDMEIEGIVKCLPGKAYELN